jgi:hypothetical protein
LERIASWAFVVKEFNIKNRHSRARIILFFLSWLLIVIIYALFIGVKRNNFKCCLIESEFFLLNFYAGLVTDRIDSISPTVCELAISGMPIEPKQQGSFSYNTETFCVEWIKPQSHHITAVMATGVPKPAMLLRKEPKEKAIINACNRLSEIIEAIKCLMISTCPLFTVTLKRNTAVITIHAMGKKSASIVAIPQTRLAINNATGVANKLDWYPLFFFIINAPKMTNTSNPVTNADKNILLNNSITCVQFIDCPPGDFLLMIN